MTAYRPEIDGLRAVAVLAIMLFHAGFGPFEGGFVGVDVFFVISGYLITSILLADLQRGEFSLARFYERRVRRIVPALLLVLLATVPLAWFILPPADLASHARAILATLGISSNFFFWKNTGYFGLDAELNPLLHTWSLAVEEQYYLVFPILLAACWRAGRTVLLTALVAALLISLALAVWGVSRHPVASFYLLPTRAWELLAGAVLVLLEPRVLKQVSTPVLGVLAWVGALLILLSVVGFDRYVKTPGPWALVPVIGTVLLILAARPGTAVGRGLATGPVVKIGLISYGAYLWHQPIFALARQLGDAPPAAATMGLLIALSLCLAHLSWRWVERPFRQARTVGSQRLIAGVVAGVAVLAALSATAWQQKGFESRYSADQLAVLRFLSYPYSEPYRDGSCFVSAKHIDGQALFDGCWRAGGLTELAIWGDSHAAALASGLHALMPGVAQFTTGGCPPLLKVNRRMFPECDAANAAALARLVALQPKALIIHANWLNYATLPYEAELDATLREVTRRLPATRITLVGMAPQWYPSLPMRMVRDGVKLVDGERIALPARERLVAIDQRLSVVAARHGVPSHSMIDVLCAGASCQAVTTLQGRLSPVTWDYGHLTEAGATLVARDLLQRLPGRWR